MTDIERAEEYRKSLKQKLIDEDEFERLEMTDEELAEAEQLLQEEQERDLLYEELLMQNYDFEYGDVIY